MLQNLFGINKFTSKSFIQAVQLQWDDGSCTCKLLRSVAEQ